MTTAQTKPDFNKISEILAAADADEAAQRQAVQSTQYPEVIDELRDLLDNLRDESVAELEKSILADGIRDAVVVWTERNAIIDGHNRIRIARKHSLPYPRVEKSFANVEAAKEWMIRNQLGRRNLTADRFDYLLGKLYNQTKQTSEKAGNLGGKRDKMDGGDTAKKLADKFGVSERTVRRAGETATGIDKLEAIKGKIAKQEQLSGKGEYTQPELAELAKTPNTTTGTKFLKKLDELKAKEKDEKKKAKVQPKPATQELYPVVFCRPDFDGLGNAAANMPRPPMDKNAIAYMFVPDHCVAMAIKLIEKWGLTYEGSFVFWSSNTEEGVYTKVAHDLLFMATKGTVIGPKRGKEAVSVQKVNGQTADAMIQIIDAYHPGVKKLDTRKGRTATGWDAVTQN